MKNKNMKKLVASFALLAMAAAMAGTSTFAWFSMNRDVKAGGIGASARAAESLVIGRRLNVGTGVLVNFQADDPANSVTAISPAEINPSTWGENAGTSVTGLKKLSGGTISTATGINSSGSLVAVTMEEKNDYFTDYVLYFAARGGSLEGDLEVTFDSTTVELLLTAANGYVGARSTIKAYTIAFFAQPVTSESTNVFTDAPVDTLRVCDCFNNGTVKTAELGHFTFPQQTEESHTSAIKVGMRLYLDGALRVQDNDLVDASKVDLGAGTDGLVQSGKTYYTYAGNGVFTLAESVPSAGSPATGLYVRAADSCYVYTEKVAGDTFTFGLAFAVTGA